MLTNKEDGEICAKSILNIQYGRRKLQAAKGNEALELKGCPVTLTIILLIHNLQCYGVY